jgi:hypothetical protein
MRWEDALLKYGAEALRSGKTLIFETKKNFDKTIWRVTLKTKVCEGEVDTEED